MILDRNICTQCGGKNFSDNDYMHNEGICKECFGITSNELDSVYWYRSLLHHIYTPESFLDNLPDAFEIFFMLTLFFIAVSFDINSNWYLLKYAGIVILLKILMWFFIRAATRLLNPEPKILKQKKFDITVDKEIYQKFELFDIYKNYFIEDKKGNNIFRVLKVEDIEKSKKDLEKIYNDDYTFVILKSLVIAYICMILTVIIYSIISGNSIYINNTKLLDLTDKNNNWITISQTSCENLGGVFNKKKNECKAKWLDAKKICRANDARLATFDEYSKAHLFTLRDENAVWTNTAKRNYITLFFNASFLRIYPDEERDARMAFTNKISQVGKPLTKSTHEKFIVKCVKGTSNYYLRNFDTKKLP